MFRRLMMLSLAVAAAVSAQPKRVLYLTHSAGFRHDSIQTSIPILRALAPDRLEVTATEDVSLISAGGLAGYDAVFFFTSGELPLSDAQKSALLDFVRSGRGFGGAHSATDTLYTWPEYNNLVGATFDGHPWTQRIRIDVEDPANPLVSHLAPGFEIEDEIYQHRDFSRARVRVLMTLDTSSVDPAAAGVNRTDGDFALAWMHPYGQGRAFYTALGHFDSTWRDPGFQQMLRNALLWLTGQIEAPAAPRPPAQPRIAADGTGDAVGNAATLSPRGISPGTLFTIYGDNFTVGSASAAVSADAPRKLGGTVVRIDGRPAQILYASPGQINALAPAELTGGLCRQPSGRCVQLDVVVPGMPAASASIGIYERTPGVFVTTANPDGALTIWATGLGAVREAGALRETVWRPRVEINGTSATVLFSGLAPGWAGLYQINVRPASPVSAPFNVRLLDE